MSAIADPNIALLLLVLGALGIYIEFSSPGLIAPGVIGTVLVILALRSFSMFPIDAFGAALMVIAFILFLVEAKFSGQGILTVLGSLAMVFGAMMLINSSRPEMRIRPAVAIGLTVPFALITSFLLSIAARARRNKVTTGVEGMIGQCAIVTADLDPVGTVLFRGEYWTARAPEHVSINSPVRIAGIDGLTLYVEAMHTETQTNHLGVA